MELRKQLNTLLAKKLSRADFIKHVAIGAVAVAGGGALLRLMPLNPDATESESHADVTAYGGSQPRSGERY